MIMLVTLALCLVAIALMFARELTSVMPEPVVYVFYAGLAFTVIYYFVMPIKRVLSMGTAPMKMPTSADEIDQFLNDLSYSDMKKLVHNLASTHQDEESENALAALKTGYDTVGTTKKLMETRYQKANDYMIKSGLALGTATAISQSGKLDGLILLSGCVKNITVICSYLGYRPSYIDLAKVYLNVFGSALVSVSFEDIFDEMVLPDSNIIGFSSLTGFVINSALVIRIGHITQSYVKSPQNFDAKAARKDAFSFVLSNKAMLLNEAGKFALDGVMKKATAIKESVGL